MRPGRGQQRTTGQEDAIQAAVCLHLTIRAMPGVVWFHVPNGGSRTAAEAGRFKALGVKAGVPDLIAVSAGCMFALELKAPGGRVSDAQRQMLAALAGAGAETAVAVGLDDALAVLERWGLISPSRATAQAAASPAMDEPRDAIEVQYTRTAEGR